MISSLNELQLIVHLYRYYFNTVKWFHLLLSNNNNSTGWNDKIVALEKMTWFHFRLMKTIFFFVTDHLLVGRNKQDQRCATVQIMLPTDPSYDNMTIASTLKMQIWISTNNERAKGDENKVSGYGYGLWCGFKWGPHHATSHLRSRLESQHQSVPGCAEECGDPLVQSSGRWQTLGVAAGLGASPQIQRDQVWLQKECYNFVPFSNWPPSSPDLNPLDYFVWSYIENITNMTSHNTKASLIAGIHRLFAELPPVLVEKACSLFRIRIEAVIQAEGNYIE